MTTSPPRRRGSGLPVLLAAALLYLATAFNVAANCIEFVNCPSNTVAYTCGANCWPVSFSVTATNNCSTNAPSVSTDWPSGYCFPLGPTTVTTTAIGSGETNHCSFTITVLTNCPPPQECLVIHCASNITAYACGTNCMPVYYSAWAENLCSPTNILVVTVPPSGTPFCAGANTVDVWAYGSGQTNHCSFTVTVLTNCGSQSAIRFKDRTNTPLGSSILTVSSNELLVANASTNDPFGAAVDFSGFPSGAITLGGSDSLTPVGAKVSMRVFGNLNGNTNQLIGTLSCVNAGSSNIDYSADFSPMGAAAYTVLVLDGTNIVATAHGLTGVLARVTGTTVGEKWTPIMSDGGQLWSVIDLPTPPSLIKLTGGLTVSGTRLLITPEATKLTFPTTPIIVVPHFTIGMPWWWPKVGPLAPPPPWPNPGDPPPNFVTIDMLSRIEVWAEHMSQFRILNEQPGKFGFIHEPVGDTSLRAGDGGLLLGVPGQGNPLGSGVSWRTQPGPIMHPCSNCPECCPGPIHLKVQWQHPRPEDIIGSFLKVNINGSLGGGTNQILGFLQATRTPSNTVAILADYSPVGSTTNIVEVYSGANLVHVDFVVNNIVLAAGLDWPSYFHGPVPLCDPRVCDPSPYDVTLGFASNVLIHLHNGTDVLGDRIRVYGNPSPQPSSKFDSFSLFAGGGVTNLTIINEELLPIGQIFNGLGHLPTGPATITTTSNELVVSSSTPNASFGTSIALGDAEGGDVTVAGPDDTSPGGSQLKVSAFGTVEGIPDQLVGSILATKNGTNIQFNADLTPLMLPVLNVSVFDGSRLVGVAAGVTNLSVTIPSKFRVFCSPGWQILKNGFFRAYINLPDRTSISIPGAPPNLVGTRIVFDGCLNCGPQPLPWVKDVLAVSRLELIANGLNSFRISQERLNKFGQLHSALGAAQLQAAGTDLQVNNLNSISDGIKYPVADGNFYRGFSAYWRHLNQFGTVLPGAILRASIEGAFVNGPEKVLGSSQIADLGFTKEISAAFFPTNGTYMRVEVLSSNLVVYSINVVGSTGAVAHVSDWALGFGTIADFSVNSPVWRFWPPARFEFNNQFYTGDEIRIIPAGVAQPLDHLSSFSLQATGIDSLDLVSAGTEPGVPATMQIQRFGNALDISWTPLSAGQVLQCANRATGPWWSVPGGSGPHYITTIGSTNQFYRVMQR